MTKETALQIEHIVNNIVEDDKKYSSVYDDDGICCSCAEKLFSSPSPQKPQFPLVEKEIAKKNS